MSEGCLEHNDCMGQIATRLVGLEGQAEKADERMTVIEGKLDQVLSTTRPPCSKVSALESTVGSYGERLKDLDEFKDGVIGQMATHTTTLGAVKDDVTEMKGDVKTLLKSDIKKNIYWGIAIAVLIFFINFMAPFIWKKITGG